MRLSSLKPMGFIAMLAMIVISCSKKGDDGKSRTEMLTSGAWKYDNASLDVNKDGTGDSPLPPGVLDDCEIDNTITFNADGTGIIDEGATKCDAADPQTSNFTWTFKNDETVINFPNQIFPNFDGDVKVESISDTKLVLSKDADLGLPQTVRVIVELKH